METKNQSFLVQGLHHTSKHLYFLGSKEMGKSVYFQDNRLCGLKIIGISVEVRCIFRAPLRARERMSFSRGHRTSGILFWEVSDWQRSCGRHGQGAEGDWCSSAVISLVCYPLGVRQQRNCVTRAMPREPRFGPRTAPSLVKRRTHAPVISASRLFWSEYSCHFLQDPRATADREHSLNQKHHRKEHSFLAQAAWRICSRKV